MPKQQRKSIEKDYIIFCEGFDEKRFIIEWLNSPALADEEGFSSDVQVIDFGGIDDLRRELASYKLMNNFGTVRALMIIRDAEQDHHGAVQSIQSALSTNGFMFPDSPAKWIYDSDNELHIGFMLFPELNAQPVNGTLEDLCSQIFARPDAPQHMSSVDSFLDDFERDYGRFTHKHKTRLHTYFSVSDVFTGQKIGEAAKSGAFDWAHPKLAVLKDFVKQMLTPHTKGE